MAHGTVKRKQGFCVSSLKHFPQLRLAVILMKSTVYEQLLLYLRVQPFVFVSILDIFLAMNNDNPAVLKRKALPEFPSDIYDGSQQVRLYLSRTIRQAKQLQIYAILILLKVRQIGFCHAALKTTYSSKAFNIWLNGLLNLFCKASPHFHTSLASSTRYAPSQTSAIVMVRPYYLIRQFLSLL